MHGEEIIDNINNKTEWGRPGGKLIKYGFLRKAKNSEVSADNSVKCCLRRILKVRSFTPVTNHYCKERINQPLRGPSVLLVILEY